MDPDRSGQRTVVLANARVRTMETPDDVHEAVAVRGSRILGVGRSDDLLRLAGPDPVVHDLGGAWLVPGFVDPHVHLESVERYERSLDEAVSAADFADQVRRLCDRLAPGEWLVAASARDGKIPLSLAGLDAASPTNPVAIALGGGYCLVNTLALPALDQRLVERDGARVFRDPSGAPTGVVLTRGEDRLKYVMPTAPLYTADTVRRAVLAGCGWLLAAGVTTTHHMIKDRLPVRAHLDLDLAGELPLRVGLLFRIHESDIPLDDVVSTGWRQPFGSEWVRFQGVKISIDGYFPAGSARFSEPYADEPDNVGTMRIDPEELNALVLRAHRAGLRVCLHANGDVAVDAALDAYEKALADTPRTDHRHRIEHFGNFYCTRGQMARLRGLGVVAVPNPPVLHERVRHAERRLGAARAGRPLAVRDMLDEGLNLAVASDGVGLRPLDPLAAIAALVTRRSGDGAVYAGDQAITPWEAMRLYTVANAWLGFEERDKGSITAGKFADFAVLSADPVTSAPDEIASISVLGTMVGGQWKYESDRAPSRIQKN